MNCDLFRQKLDAFFDGALSASEQAAFEAHRLSCVDCRRAAEQARRLDALLHTELTHLAMPTAAERLTLREGVLQQLGLPSEGEPIGETVPIAERLHGLRLLPLVGLASILVVGLVLVLTLLPGNEQAVSASEVLDRAWAAIGQYDGMTGVLHWEGEWSQRFPSVDEITRTFEIWFQFDKPERYHVIHRDSEGMAFSEMVRDGVDHMWQISRTITTDGRRHLQVDEILLSPEEMHELGSWYVPTPFLDDLDRLAQVVDDGQKADRVEVAGRPAYRLRAQLYGFGWPNEENRLQPVTSTVTLIIDAQTYWVLGRAEWARAISEDEASPTGVVQRTSRFAILSPRQIPPGTFEFTPPPAADVRSIDGIAGYYTPQTDTIGLDEAASLTSFTLVVPADPPADLKAFPHLRYRGTEKAGAFGMVYVGYPGRQALLLERDHANLPARAARLIAVGQREGWLVSHPIDGRKFSLYLMDHRPAIGPDGRPWPASFELQAWGLTVEEAVEMLRSLKPVP